VQAICCNPSRTSFLTGLPDSQAAPFRNGDWLIRAKIEQQKAGPDKTTVE
jgi:arylsulfatase A-like enzyme